MGHALISNKVKSLWPGSSISGPILFAMWALALGDYFVSADLATAATILAWTFVAIELPRLKAKQRPLILALGLVGAGCSVLAWSFGSQTTAVELLDEHLKLAMLLTAISFIGLAMKPQASQTSKGLKSYLSTFLGMHFFSSVANFSALPVVGDQLQRKGEIDRLSQSILARGFSLSVLWSPFLSITPLVLEQVPGAYVGNIYPYSIPLAVTGLMLTILESRFRYQSRFANYQGYPMKLSTLHLPILLISSVLLLTWLYPGTSTVILVSIVAVFIPLGIVSARSGIRTGGETLKLQIFERISESRTEISLFLCAGLLAAGVKACIELGLISLPFTETNAMVGSFSLITIVVIASLGINQLAVVAIMAGLLADVTTTPTIMAVAYIYATALSMSTSVFSGTNMILRARYNCRSRAILRNQLPFTLLMLAIGIATLFLMEALNVK
ncbi:MAG: hypothetical protein CSA60_01930 [Neptuniibacter caesariensis]|uniref:Uncharacterized protein n=1 Tax=Neptuniibacter caesariensis TaxID=207954 RepID=A0A2G6JPE2_NEPCE|nr:MAG: hypothetical protein CSA60_01930 [Neptuniibacter caesariensis]